MPLRLACQCGARFQTNSKHAGKGTKCPACGESLTIPVEKNSKPTLEARTKTEALIAGDDWTIDDFPEGLGELRSRKANAKKPRRKPCPQCGYPRPSKSSSCDSCELLAEGIRIESVGDTLTFSQNWSARVGIVKKLYFTAILSLLGIIFAGIGILAMRSEGWNNFMIGLPAGLLVAIVGGYECIGQIVNRTRLRVSKENLTLRHEPIAFLGNRRIPAEDIEQFYVVSASDGEEHFPTRWFNLYVLLNSGKRRSLLKRIRSESNAIQIEEMLESFLGIDDEPVESTWWSSGDAPMTGTHARFDKVLGAVLTGLLGVVLFYSAKPVFRRNIPSGFFLGGMGIALVCYAVWLIGNTISADE